jgi:hypothetical protein
LARHDHARQHRIRESEHLRRFSQNLTIIWGEASELFPQTNAVVKCLNIIKNAEPCFGSGLVIFMTDKGTLHVKRYSACTGRQEPAKSSEKTGTYRGCCKIASPKNIAQKMRFEWAEKSISRRIFLLLKRFLCTIRYCTFILQQPLSFHSINGFSKACFKSGKV